MTTDELYTMTPKGKDVKDAIDNAYDDLDASERDALDEHMSDFRKAQRRKTHRNTYMGEKGIKELFGKLGIFLALKGGVK